MAYEVVSTGRYQFPIGKGKIKNVNIYELAQKTYQFPIGKGKRIGCPVN